MYLPAILFPWHENARKWKKKGRRDIFESLSQWNEEGGYIQPSHNYHRLALNYLVYAKLLADADSDVPELIDGRKEEPMLGLPWNRSPTWDCSIRCHLHRRPCIFSLHILEDHLDPEQRHLHRRQRLRRVHQPLATADAHAVARCSLASSRRWLHRAAGHSGQGTLFHHLCVWS